MRNYLILLASIAIAACDGGTVAPATVGTSSGADAAKTDGALGDGASSGSADGTAGDTSGIAGSDLGAASDGSLSDAAGSDLASAGNDTSTTGSDAAATGSDSGSPPPLDAAQPDGAVAKYQLCSQLLSCVFVACGGSADPKCADICLGSASPLAASGVAPFLSCVTNYCVNGMCAGNQSAKCIGDCTGQKCIVPAIACGADGKSGGADCTTVFGCIDGCKEKGLDCMSGCYAALTKGGQKQLDDLVACGNASGGKDPFAACPSQALTCIAAGKSGTGKCAPLFACMDGCNSLSGDAAKTTCLSGCWSSATPAAQQQWIEISKCINAPTPSCGPALAACAEPSGTKTCLDAIGCWGACDAAQKKADCHLGCITAATPAEGNKAANLLICVGSQCKYCNGDKTCEDTCTKTKCKAELDNCLK